MNVSMQQDLLYGYFKKVELLLWTRLLHLLNAPAHSSVHNLQFENYAPVLIVLSLAQCKKICHRSPSG